MALLALQRFTETHPPYGERQQGSTDRVAFWRDYVPDSLIELWGYCGFGFFGASQLCLLNPDEWLSILECWVAPTGGVLGLAPILMSPFGDLFYYRRISMEEVVSVIYFDTCEVTAIGWNLEDFFNGILCNSNQLRNLMPAQLDRIQARYGLLDPGQIYRMVPPKNGKPISVEKAPARQIHEQRLAEILKMRGQQ